MRVKAWTVERPTEEGGVLIDDIKLTKSEAVAEADRRGGFWAVCEIELDIPTGIDVRTEPEA